MDAVSDQNTTHSASEYAAIMELLASRICHDLISPIGAVNNGVEFLQDMGADAVDDATGLIAYSASQAAAKLQAFRLAYGAGGSDQNIKLEDVHSTFSDMVQAEGKVSQNWDPHALDAPAPLPRGFCKMLMAGLMLSFECLPKGGTIRVQAAPDRDHTMLIIAEGDGVSMREGVEDAIARKTPVEELDPRLIHPYAISLIGEGYGISFTLESQTSAALTLQMHYPQPEL